jgi:DNA (cytosine-5)-methyltransferase 1
MSGRDQFTLDLGHELIADNFAGGGGASTALRMAFGREPDIAINHDGEALSMHAANHPTTAHYREDVFLPNPRLITRNLPVGAVWFSPTCTHFSKAKGFNILNQKTRGLAWVVLKWGVQIAPRLMFLENVAEFLGWGPLDESGRPIKALKGRTFNAFILALTTGLPEDHPDMPEIRDTLGDDFPIERIIRGLGYKVEWRTLHACDFGAPTIRKRLFMVMRRDGMPIVWPAPTHGPRNSPQVLAGTLLPYRTAAECIDWSIECPSIFERKKPLRPATLRRVGKGYEKYVKDAAQPYIVETARGEVSPLIQPLTHQGADRTSAATDPLPTITCAHRGEMSLAAVTMVQMGYGEREGQAPRALDLHNPVGTIVAGGGKHALVAASVVQYYKGGGQNMAANGPMPTIVTKDRVGVTCAYLAKHYQGVVGAPVTAPAPTVTTVDHNSLVTAHLVAIDNQSYGDSATWAAADPLTTITTENRHAVVTSNLVKLRGTSHAAATDEPLATISAGGQHHGEVRTTLTSAPANDPAYLERRQQVREFLWEYCPSLKGVAQPELVKINGEMMEVVDIGLRMLQPRELANAQGFPADYILDPFHTSIDKRGRTVRKRLSKGAQVRMIGNSVSPPPAVAVLKANNAHELLMARAA